MKKGVSIRLDISDAKKKSLDNPVTARIYISNVQLEK